jgi:hypothetical protein
MADKATEKMEQARRKADSKHEQAQEKFARARERHERREGKTDEFGAFYNGEQWHNIFDGRRMPGKRHVFWRVFWGLLFLIAAASIPVLGLLTSSIGVWWLVLAVFLAAVAVASLVSLHWFGVFLPLAGMVAILHYQTDWLPFTLNDAMISEMAAVALLLSISFSILFRRKSRRELHWQNYMFFDESSDEQSKVTIAAKLGQTIRYIESKKLEKVFVDCTMGGVKAYFNNAELAGDTLTINIRAVMSGVQLYVPKHWRVENNISSVAGGVVEKGRVELSPDAPKVNLVGTNNMGGVEIFYI